MDTCARATPSRTSLATPAATNPAAALATTISRRGPISPARIARNNFALCAASPPSNALISAHRYRTLEAEATAAIVLTTVAYAATASLWLWVLGQFFS